MAVQGPKAIEAMQQLTDFDLSSLPFYAHTTTTFAGLNDVLVATTGYTGAGGVEIYCKNEVVADLWKAVFEAGADYGIQPIGLAARDTLRLEMGYCLYGNEIDDTTSRRLATQAYASILGNLAISLASLSSINNN